MIIPDKDFHRTVRALTEKAGALLILDETHTLSTGPGGATRAWGLEPDALVVGKAIAGGFPAAVWGVSAELGDRIGATAKRSGGGRSGIGTTLAGNAMGIAAISATLRELATPDAYEIMLRNGAELGEKLWAVIKSHDLPWCVIHLGARVEIVFAAAPPRNAEQMRPALAQSELNRALHLYLINRGVLIAPFHMMMLVSPSTTTQQIDRLVAAVDSFAEGYAQESAT
jgi:glutamate-1-semialdehyde 2,1-aminomutase